MYVPSSAIQSNDARARAACVKSTDARRRWSARRWVVDGVHWDPDEEEEEEEEEDEED